MMNADCDLITEKLYLGSCTAAEDLDVIKTLKITHVLIVGNWLEAVHKDVVTYKQFFLHDLVEEDIGQYFEEAFEFIEEGMKSGNVLVHCAAGVSRSASVVIAYMMKKNQMRFDDAFKLVKSKRDCVYPNSGFIKQLKAYEKTLSLHLKDLKDE